jgi:CubicO group peptidase (beta-lactamase class C family)
MIMTIRHLLLTAFLLVAACTAPGPVQDQQSAATSSSASVVEPVLGGTRGETLPTNDGILFWTPAETEVGFRAIDKVAPQAMRVVKRGERVREFRRAQGPALDVRFNIGDKAHDTTSYMADYRVSGIVVIKDGEILLEQYGLGRRPEDRWISFSVTKSLTSTLIGAAIKDGYIKSLDDTLEQYVSEMKGSVYAGVTIRHLLTMSSGVKWNEGYTDPNSDVARAGRVQFEGEPSPILGYMRRLDRAQPAGAKFHYSTGETDLAGYVVSRATGMTMADYLSKKIWAPYGMEQDALWLMDSSGHERGGCCLNMTLRDYARIGQFMLEDGAGVTPAGWVKEATSALLPVADDPASGGYGYFWWINGDRFDALGIFGQMIHVDPKEKLVIAINSAWPYATNRDYSIARTAFVKAATAAALAR